MKMKNVSVFKTMRHIETVRNYLNVMIKELLKRGEQHDQSKLQSPEVEIFDEYTAKLRTCEYGSDEYKSYLKGMGKALEHHYSVNRHHPQFYNLYKCPICKYICDEKDTLIHTGIENKNNYKFCPICCKQSFIFECVMDKYNCLNGMNLIDLIEMFVDWYAATKRHDTGNIYKSIELNQNRDGYSDEVKEIFKRTAEFLENKDVFHKADES